MLRGVIFDHDGTLIDTEKQHYHVWNQLLADFGQQLSEEEYLRDHNGVPTIGSATMLVERFQLEITPDQLSRKKEAHVHERTKIPPLMPGARDILMTLHRLQIPMAVATGARQHEVKRNLDHHDLHSLFRAVCSSCQVERNKPAPDVYLLAAEKLQLAPSECLAVEDTLTGMRSALAAGMPCVVIPSAHFEFQDYSAATKVMTDLSALEQWLSVNWHENGFKRAI